MIDENYISSNNSENSISMARRESFEFEILEKESFTKDRQTV